MRRHLAAAAAAAVAVASIVSLIPASAAFADSDDESTYLTEVLDGGYGLGRVDAGGVTVADTSQTTSDLSLQLVVATYEAADIACVLRQASNEEGDLLNEETDLCEDDEGISTADLVALVSSEFKTLPLAAPAITAQPDGDWALVNVDFVVFTEADQQLLSTTILGVPVTIRATPVHYSWDFGDGSPALATTDQGQPYPNQTVAHVYTSAMDAVAVGLTTSWQGELQINGSGPWLPIAGFATTTSSTDEVEIVAMDVHLVP